MYAIHSAFQQRFDFTYRMGVKERENFPEKFVVFEVGDHQVLTPVNGSCLVIQGGIDIGNEDPVSTDQFASRVQGFEIGVLLGVYKEITDLLQIRPLFNQIFQILMALIILKNGMNQNIGILSQMIQIMLF